MTASTKGPVGMVNGESEEVRLLREIRDLLRPVADAYQDQYAERQALRRRELEATVRETVDASVKRRTAWNLADGSRSQREIHKQSGMDEGGLSKFFKRLRELDAIEGDPPKRTMEV